VQAALPGAALLFNYFTTGVLDNQAPFLRTLTRDNPLREHLLTPPRTLLFAIDQHGLTVHQQPVDPNAFASASLRHEDRSRLLAPKTLSQFYKMLLPANLFATLPTSVRRLYLVPHGPLHHVPFGALLDATGEALLRAAGPSLAYAPSATILRQQLRGRAPAVLPTRQALCIGYAGTAENRQLRHTASEAQWIAQLTGGEAWVGAQPKKSQLAASVADYRWLHFACHGWFNHNTPLASYLEIGADEHLTAEEILQTWRLQAELVTLSACQTGVHRLLRSDEPIGLIRAFLTAGARAVLASQWPVEDLPTFLLMQKFYEQLVAGGLGVAVALQQAQLWLRTATQEAIKTIHQANAKAVHALADELLSELPLDPQPFAHPRYWAGFVIFGG
jgi:CHAT domain-containing protein